MKRNRYTEFHENPPNGLMLVTEERWKARRAVDIGQLFNL